MAGILILLSILLSCQIVQDLACGGDGGRSLSKIIPRSIDSNLRQGKVPRKHWIIPKNLQDQFNASRAEYKKKKKLRKKLHKNNPPKPPIEIDLPDTFEGYGFPGEDPPPWAIFKGQQGKPDYCFMDPDAGHCTQKMKRWGYNYYAKKCVQFEYSGCGGNFNNFKTQLKCLDMCVRFPQSDHKKDEEYLTYDVNDTVYKFLT